MGREEKDRVVRKAGRKTGKEMKNQTTAERGKEKTGRPAWRLREINPNRHKRNMLYLLTAPLSACTEQLSHYRYYRRFNWYTVHFPRRWQLHKE
jgi:hypothetical protein